VGDKSLHERFSGTGSSNAYINWIGGYSALNLSSVFPIDNLWFNDHRALVSSMFPKVQLPALGWLETTIAHFVKMYKNVTIIPQVNSEWATKGQPFPVVVTGINIKPARINLYAPNAGLLKKLGTKVSDKWVWWKVDDVAWKKSDKQREIAYPGSLKKWTRLNKGCVQFGCVAYVP
jgi:hypothetical protein